MIHSDDLVARIAAADPVSTTEPLGAEEEREAALLLERLLATPVQEKGVSPRPTRRRRRGLVAVAFAVSLAIALALVVSPARRSLADRAYAAVTAPNLFHVVVRSTFDNLDFTGASAKHGEAGTIESESWYDTRAVAFHTLNRVISGDRGALFVREAAGDKTGTVARGGARSGAGPASGVAELGRDGGTKDVIPRRFDPTAETKAFLRDPNVHEDGAVTIDGRRAKRLVIDRPDRPARGGMPAVVDGSGVALVDAKTLYPIEFREQAFFVRRGVRQRFATIIRYKTFETLPRTPQNLRLLEMGTRP